MSDHDAPHDPIDKAYAQAEAMLDDEAARAARRARVLGAVAGEAGTAPIVSAPPKRRVSWAAGGWLAAASVAGVSALVAFQLSTPPVMQRQSSPETSVAAAPAPAQAPATAPAVEAAPPAPTPAPPAPTAAPRAGPRSSRDVPAPAPSAFPAPPSQTAAAPVAAPAPPPPPAAPPAAEDAVEALVRSRQAEAPPAARATADESGAVQAPAPASPMAQAPAPASPAVRTARLHAAAAAGRLAELTALLAQGTPVDAPDSEGETALMKSIQARNPAAAALLRRHGASLDRTDRTGVSARDMAASIDDPELNRALGLGP